MSEDRRRNRARLTISRSAIQERLPRDRRQNVLIVVAAMLVMAAGTLPVTVIPILFPLIESDVLGVSTGHLALGTSLFFGLASTSAPFAGRLADRWGLRRSACLVGVGATAIVLGLLTVRSPWVLVGVMGSGGLFNALAFTSSNLGMGKVLHTARPGMLFGIKQTTVPIVSASAGFIVGVSGATTGWTVLLAVFLVVPTALLGVLLVLPPDSSEVARPPRDSDRPTEHDRPVGSMVPVYFIGFFTGIAISTLAGFGVVTLERVGLSPSKAGAVFGAASVVGLVARAVVGWVADRKGGPLLNLVGALLAGGALGGLLVATGEPLVVSIGILLAYALGWSSPGVLLFAVARAFPTGIGRATGGLMTTQGLGITCGPLIFALAEQHASLEVAWMVAAASSGIAALVAIWTARTRDRVTPQMST